MEHIGIRADGTRVHGFKFISAKTGRMYVAHEDRMYGETDGDYLARLFGLKVGEPVSEKKFLDMAEVLLIEEVVQ